MSLININLAPQSSLTRLHGIGPVLAKRIIEWRKQNSYFPTIEALMWVPGIGLQTVQQNRQHMTAEVIIFCTAGQTVLSQPGPSKGFDAKTIALLFDPFIHNISVLNLWESQREQSNFEFKWIRRLTEMQMEVVSEVPPIPDEINSESIQSHLEEIRPTWQREHRYGRILNSAAGILDVCFRWLQPTALTNVQRLVQLYFAGAITWAILNANWNTGGHLIFSALVFPIDVFMRTFYGLGSGDILFNYWGVLLIVLVAVYRIGLRAAIVIWLVLLLR